MQGDIQFCCISCDACQRRETPHRRPPLPTRRVPVDRPFQRVAIDLVEYTPYTVSQGCMYVLPVIDHLTRLVILAAIANKEVTTLARTLVDRVVSVFGVPELYIPTWVRNLRISLFKSCKPCSIVRKLIPRRTGHKVNKFRCEYTAPCITC